MKKDRTLRFEQAKRVVVKVGSKLLTDELTTTKFVVMGNGQIREG
jgi:glutamate 5-kinase